MANLNTVFARLCAHTQISAQPLFFTVRVGTASANVMKNLVKLPPRRSMRSEITYLSSCRVCKPALNSTISAVTSRSHCSYSLHDRTIDQIKILVHAFCCGKHVEQRERISAIMARHCDLQLIECAVKRNIANTCTPSTENLPNLCPYCAVNQANTVITWE